MTTTQKFSSLQRDHPLALPRLRLPLPPPPPLRDEGEGAVQDAEGHPEGGQNGQEGQLHGDACVCGWGNVLLFLFSGVF